MIVPEKTLEAIQKAIEAKLIVNLELSETEDGFVMVKVDGGQSQHQFCIPNQEDVARLVCDYMDSQEVLRGAAISLEQVWNQLSFEGRVLTALLYSHAEGLEVSADFRYSPLRSDSLWQAALREWGLYIVHDLGSSTAAHRHLVLAKDPILA